jgi:hypothetical protein
MPYRIMDLLTICKTLPLLIVVYDYCCADSCQNGSHGFFGSDWAAFINTNIDIYIAII